MGIPVLTHRHRAQGRRNSTSSAQDAPPQGDFTIPRQPRETQSPRRHQAGFRPDFGWMPGLGAEGNDQCMTSPPYPSETDVTASLPRSKGADRANGAVRP